MVVVVVLYRRMCLWSVMLGVVQPTSYCYCYDVRGVVDSEEPIEEVIERRDGKSLTSTPLTDGRGCCSIRERSRGRRFRATPEM